MLLKLLALMRKQPSGLAGNAGQHGRGWRGSRLCARNQFAKLIDRGPVAFGPVRHRLTRVCFPFGDQPQEVQPDLLKVPRQASYQ